LIQIKCLVNIIKIKEGGYNGVFSFEPFSQKIHNMPDVANKITKSIDYLKETCSLN
tara:strand:- start:1080 stop:1247 length:168 start_codon:yes stop_codon:yes gene_type:complete